MLGGPGRTGRDGILFPIHRDWNGRHVSMDGVCEHCKDHGYKVMTVPVLLYSIESWVLTQEGNNHT